MSKSNTNFIKTTNTNNGQSIDASNVLIDGVPITTSINTLISENTTEAAQLSGCAVLANPNVFTNQITFNNNTPIVNTVPSNTNHVVTKSYVDNSISNIPNILTNNNTFLGTNTFNVLPTSSGTVTNNNDLTNKSYVDTKTTLNAVQSNNNTFTGSNTFTNLPFSNSTPSSNFQLTNKSYVDTKTTLSAVQANANTFTAATNFNNNVIVQYTFSAGNGACNFTALPTIDNNYLPTSASASNVLSTKGYVDNAISSVVAQKSDTIVYGQQSFLTQSGNTYILTAPNIGTSTTSNTTGFNIDFYLNFPNTSNNGLITPFTNGCTFEFNYFSYQPTVVSSITGYVSSSNNTATFNTAITSSQIGSQVGIFGLTNINALFNIIIKNSSVLVYAPIQTKNIWNNPTLTTNTQTPVQFSNTYGSVGIVMKYYPINFAYVNDNKVKITVGFPNQLNNPATSFWISNLGFSAKINNSNIMTSSNFVNGLSLTPNINSNTNSGSAFFTLN